MHINLWGGLILGTLIVLVIVQNITIRRQQETIKNHEETNRMNQQTIQQQSDYLRILTNSGE